MTATKQLPPLDPDQQRAVDLVLEGHNVFLTGKAGTGKSTVIRMLREVLPGEIAYLAPTGMAARNVEGVTVHGFFHFEPAPLPLGYVSELTPDQKRVIDCVGTIVVDEISMVRSDLFSAMDATLRHYAPPRSRMCPFGGKQIVVVGDFLQLPPVVRPAALLLDLERDFGGVWAFQTTAWHWADFRSVVLQKAHRQAVDQTFLRYLDRLRRGGDGFAMPDLQTCIEWFNTNARICGQVPHGTTALCTTRSNAVAINRIKDSALEGPVYTCEAQLWGTFEEEDHPTDRWLEFRVGSRVMLLVNQSNGDGYANGDTGHIVAYDPDEEQATIQLDDQRCVIVGRFQWTRDAYAVTRHPQTGRPHLEREPIGGFKQLPLKLAYGLTIHKAQGCTLSRAHVDLGRGAFADGQTYTALSRCKSLAGLSLSRALDVSDVMVDQAVLDFYDRLENGGVATPSPAIVLAD